MKQPRPLMMTGYCYSDDASIQSEKSDQNSAELCIFLFHLSIFCYTSPHEMVIVSTLFRRMIMKKIFFSLVLLASAAAIATVKLDVAARCGNDTTEKSFELTQDAQDSKSVSISHESGLNVIVSLTKEEADSATFVVEVKKDEKELNRSEVTAKYNEKIAIKCPVQDVDAELSLLATPVNPA